MDVRSGRKVYIGSKDGLRFCNAVWGMGKGFLCLYHLRISPWLR